MNDGGPAPARAGRAAAPGGYAVVASLVAVNGKLAD